MACYHPIAGFPDYSELGSNGKRRYRLEGSFHPDLFKLDPNVIKIPCGKCLGCRLDYSRSWADRMMLELASQDNKGIFVTLTYNNDHVPMVPFVDDNGEVIDGLFSGMTLDKRDLQLFWKRLRKFFDKPLRYYSCGEYGSHTHRPHYHAIIFGLSLSDFSDLRLLGQNELHQNYYSSEKFESIWQNGFVVLSEVSYETCAYVSRYVAKKVFSDDFVPDGSLNEFVLMSRRPGLGYGFFEKDPERFLTESSIFLSTSNGSKKISVPRYFMDKLSLLYPDEYDSIKNVRGRFSRDRDLLKLQGTSLSYIDLLELEENSLLNKTKILFKKREEVL